MLALLVATPALADIGNWTVDDCSVEAQSALGDHCESCPVASVPFDGGPGGPFVSWVTEPSCLAVKQRQGLSLRCEARSKGGYEDVFCAGGAKPMVPRAAYEALPSRGSTLATLALVGVGTCVVLFFGGVALLGWGLVRKRRL